VYLRGEGITPENRADVERHYADELADLEAILRRRPFLFGDRPSLADFGYFASMFRHFGIDPTPSRIMRNTAPAVYEWVARMWNARAATLGAWPGLQAPTDFRTGSNRCSRVSHGATCPLCTRTREPSPNDTDITR
jgi:glutathione S-transferase